MDGQQIGIAIVVSMGIAAMALWRGWLSRSGGVGALIVGTLILGLGGWQWGLLLFIFFVSSSLFSRFKTESKQDAAQKFDKGHQRDIAQVFANGGIGSIVAILHIIFPTIDWFPFFVGVMGAVTADTWATELGTLSKHRPRLITTGQKVESGTSGGISIVGTAASLLGGLLIGAVAGFGDTGLWRHYLLIGSLGGLGGSLFDSFLGATVQRVYYDDIDNRETEKRFRNGREFEQIRGWSWMNNDMVNLLASVIGGCIGATTGMLMGV